MCIYVIKNDTRGKIEAFNNTETLTFFPKFGFILTVQIL